MPLFYDDMKRAPANINLLTCSDANYAMPLAVLISSLCGTVTEARITLYWFALEVPDDVIQKVSGHAASQGVVLRPVPFSREDLPSNLYESGRINAAAYMRLFMSDKLPHAVERVIYLDADTLVLGSLRKLWDVNLDGHAVGVVADAPYLNLSHLGARKPLRYFNSGVMLIDVGAWRRQQVGNKLMQVIADSSIHLRFHDQDALNLVLGAHALFLPSIWNFLPTRENKWRLRLYGLLARMGLTGFLPDMIVHFAAKRKPWHYLGSHPFKWRFNRYLVQSPWHGYIPDDFTKRNRVLKHTPRLMRKWMKRYVLKADS